MLLSTKNPMAFLLLLSTMLLPAAFGFRPHMHQSLAAMQTTKTTTALQVFDGGFLLSDAISDPEGVAVAAAAAAAGVPDPTSMFNMNVGETVRNVAVGATALIFLFVALTSLLAAVLIPAGAEQLELECTALIPATWNEYLAKLEEGQAMKDRPDLMFELGLLLNKCKADRLEQVCVEAKLAPDLWQKYQNQLEPEQGLQDRPELIVELGLELSQRAGQVLKENTNICPPATWAAYEEKAGNDELLERPGLLEELAQELGYTDLVGATTACLLSATDASPIKEEGDARADATTVSGIIDIRQNTDQWEDDE